MPPDLTREIARSRVRLSRGRLQADRRAALLSRAPRMPPGALLWARSAECSSPLASVRGTALFRVHPKQLRPGVGDWSGAATGLAWVLCLLRSTQCSGLKS